MTRIIGAVQFRRLVDRGVHVKSIGVAVGVVVHTGASGYRDIRLGEVRFGVIGIAQIVIR